LAPVAHSLAEAVGDGLGAVGGGHGRFAFDAYILPPFLRTAKGVNRPLRFGLPPSSQRLPAAPERLSHGNRAIYLSYAPPGL
jgi:hypothetical protein